MDMSNGYSDLPRFERQTSPYFREFGRTVEACKSVKNQLCNEKSRHDEYLRDLVLNKEAMRTIASGYLRKMDKIRELVTVLESPSEDDKKLLRTLGSLNSMKMNIRDDMDDLNYRQIFEHGRILEQLIQKTDNAKESAKRKRSESAKKAAETRKMNKLAKGVHC